MIGGAWPFLVGGVICQVYSGNERDHDLYLIAAIYVIVGHRETTGLQAGGSVAITGL